MPCLSVAVELGQPEQAPCIVQIDHALAEAAVDDVAAVVGDRRAHAGFDQFLDLLDDLGVGRIVADILDPRPAPAKPLALAPANSGALADEMVEQHRDDLRLELPPSRHPARR